MARSGAEKVSGADMRELAEAAGAVARARETLKGADGQAALWAAVATATRAEAIRDYVQVRLARKYRLGPDDRVGSDGAITRAAGE
jgi:hypothetical protein